MMIVCTNDDILVVAKDGDQAKAKIEEAREIRKALESAQAQRNETI